MYHSHNTGIHNFLQKTPKAHYYAAHVSNQLKNGCRDRGNLLWDLKSVPHAATWKHISLTNLSITDCRDQSATAIRRFNLADINVASSTASFIHFKLHETCNNLSRFLKKVGKDARLYGMKPLMIVIPILWHTNSHTK